MPTVHLQEDLTKEEFSTWLPPSVAIVRLMERNGWDRSQTIKALLTRLSVDLVAAAAADVVFKPNARAQERRYLRFVPYTNWNPDWTWLQESDFWDVGDIVFQITDGGPGYNIRVHGEISFFDVRLKPSDIDAMSPSLNIAPAPQTVQPEAPADRRPLSDALLQKWAVLFNEAYPNPSEKLARQSVDGMFPDKHVSRERLRRVLPERQRGRPLKNNGLDNSPETGGE